MSGDREMNLTADEAAALGYAAQRRPRYRRELHAPADPQVPVDPSLVFGIAAAIVVLLILAALSPNRGGSPGADAQNTKQQQQQQQQQSISARQAAEPADTQVNIAKSPDATIETHSEPRPEYLPTGWEWAYPVQDVQLFDSGSVQIGVIPQGSRFFYTSTGTPLGQLVVAEDGSIWGYNHAQGPTPTQRTLELRPEWQKAVAIIQALTSQGYLQQIQPQFEESQDTESESILPEGYGYGCVGTIPGSIGQGEWLLSISRLDGRAYRVAFMPHGTCLVIDVSPTPFGYRKVASLDGKYRGYAWFPGTLRPRMTPEMKGAIKILQQIP